MTFVRMGTSCLVRNAAGEILLAQREDLRIWTIPGGRLDRGETLWAAAAREVREETGIEVEITRALNLYYITRWNRMNVVFEARPVGGALLGRTSESVDNRWFPPDALPDNLSRPVFLQNALSGIPAFYASETPPAEYRRLRRKFALRYVRNLLSGRPEARFPRFNVHIVAVIWDAAHERVLAWQDGHLPRINPAASSDYTLWQWIKNTPQQFGTTISERRWVGIWQNPDEGAITFVFRASAQNQTGNFREPSSFTEREASFIHRSDEQAIWLLDGRL
ncbi:MAG: hypothetical protein OHK0046_43450 [Anaerolineae bacterium]